MHRGQPATASRRSSCGRASSGAAATRRCCRVMVEMVRAGRFAWIGGGRHRTSTTHVDNVVEGLVLARRARRARRRLLRHRRRARRLPRLHHRACSRRRASTPPGALAAGAGRPRRGGARRRPLWRLLPLPGRPPLTRFAVWVSAAGDDHRHHTRAHRARLRAGQDHRAGVARTLRQRMRIAVGSDHAGFHLKEHVKRGAGGAGPRRRRRRDGIARVGRLPALRGRRRAPGRRRRGRPRRAGLRVGRRRGDRRQQGRRHARGQRARPVEAEMARRHNDVNVVTLSGARLGPSEADAIVARVPARRSSRAAATPAASARSRLDARARDRDGVATGAWWN